MIKNKKVQKLFLQNNIERDNYTLVIRLKKKIEQLNAVIEEHERTILSFKKDVKTTKINEMEIQLQHLNDQNKRLLLLTEELKGKNKCNNILSPKKTLMNNNKFQQRKPVITEMKFESKMCQILKENQLLKKELLNLKINQNLLKKRKSTLNDRSSIFIEKNLIDYEKLFQKKMDLQAQKVLMNQKIRKLQSKIELINKRNEELQKIHHKHLVIDPCTAI